MIKSSLLNYELPNSSINQEPYENPLDSQLLICLLYTSDAADE